MLTDVYVDISDPDIVFTINYSDADGDDGTVYVFIDNEPQEMHTTDHYPEEGQYYAAYVLESEIDDYTEFFFYADDNNGSSIFLNDSGDPFLVGDYLGWGEHPVLSSPDVYYDGDDWVFNVTYQDPDGDEADWVEVFLEMEYYTMATTDTDPFEGQNYEVRIIESMVTESTEFYFTAQDINGSYADLYDLEWDPFVVGDFITGTNPVLSDPDVYLDGSYVVFEVTYQDDDGDEGFVNLYLDDNTNPTPMTTNDPNSVLGQVYSAYIPRSQIQENTEFYFYANDQSSGDTYHKDTGGLSFTVGDFTDIGGGGEGDTGVDLGPWGNPEVVVGIVALIAMGGGSAYGVWRRKKKRGRFSELLTKLDDVYRSYKLNPHKNWTMFTAHIN
jgi:hypothetical protein